jgi:hypothetical protein
MNFGGTVQNGNYESPNFKTKKMTKRLSEVNRIIIQAAETNMKKVRSNLESDLKEGIKYQISGDGFYECF